MPEIEILDIEGAIERLKEDNERLHKENEELLNSIYYEEVFKKLVKYYKDGDDRG